MRCTIIFTVVFTQIPLYGIRLWLLSSRPCETCFTQSQESLPIRSSRLISKHPFKKVENIAQTSNRAIQQTSGVSLRPDLAYLSDAFRQKYGYISARSARSNQVKRANPNTLKSYELQEVIHGSLLERRFESSSDHQYRPPEPSTTQSAEADLDRAVSVATLIVDIIADASTHSITGFIMSPNAEQPEEPATAVFTSLCEYSILSPASAAASAFRASSITKPGVAY